MTSERSSGNAAADAEPLANTATAPSTRCAATWRRRGHGPRPRTAPMRWPGIRLVATTTAPFTALGATAALAHFEYVVPVFIRDRIAGETHNGVRQKLPFIGLDAGAAQGEHGNHHHRQGW